MKGERSEVMGLEFCEKVPWKYLPGKRMAKFDARWWRCAGLFLGVDRGGWREQRGEVCPHGQARPKGATVGPQQLGVDHGGFLWNWRGGDKEANGDLPEFDVKKGRGRRLTEEEKQDFMRDEAPRTIHRAHLRRADFDEHGFTERPPGCSAILRGLHVKQDGDGSIIRHSGEEHERDPRHGEEEEAGRHLGPGDQVGGSDPNRGVVRSVQGRVLE